MSLEEIKLVAETEFKIRFSEVDSLRMVWHGHYLQYFELGREAFGEKYHLEYLSVYEKGFVVPLVRTVVEHKAPLVYGDSAIVITEYEDTPAAKIKFKYKIFSKNTGLLAATGETIQVFLNTDGELNITMPPFFEEWKRKWNLV